MLREVKDRISKTGYDLLADLAYKYWYVPMLMAPIEPRKLSWQTRLVVRLCKIGYRPEQRSGPDDNTRV